MEHRKIIVVGVDGSPASRSALRWAVEQGSGTVEAVMATVREPALVPAASMGVHPYAVNPALEHQHPERRLHEAVTEVLAGMPDAPEVAEIVATGSPATVLVEASRRADLLVIGAKGHSPIAEVFPGSVASHCVRHAVCPLVVIPPAAVR